MGLSFKIHISNTFYSAILSNAFLQPFSPSFSPEQDSWVSLQKSALPVFNICEEQEDRR